MRFAKSKWKNVLKKQKKAEIKEAERRQIREFLNRMDEIKRQKHEKMVKNVDKKV